MDSVEYSYLKTGVISVIIVGNIAMNSLLIVVLTKHAELREDRTALFMLSLALGDLLTALTVFPISAAVSSNATPSVRQMTSYLPMVNMSFLVTTAFVSMHSQAWVALSKMVSVLKPLKYDALLSRVRCYCVITSIWVVGVVIGAGSTSLQSDTWNTDMCTNQVHRNSTGASVFALVYYTAAIITPEVALIYATARIFIIVARAHKQVAAQELSVHGSASVSASGTVTLKAVRSSSKILVICFVALGLTVPMFVHMVLWFIVYDGRTIAAFSFAALWVNSCNTFLNSFMYVVLHRSIRRKVRLILIGMHESCRR